MTHNAYSPRTPFDTAYEAAGAARDQIDAEIKARAEQAAADFIRWMEATHPQYLHAIRSEDSAIENIGEALHTLVDRPNPEDEGRDAEDGQVREPEDM